MLNDDLYKQDQIIKARNKKDKDDNVAALNVSVEKLMRMMLILSLYNGILMVIETTNK